MAISKQTSNMRKLILYRQPLVWRPLCVSVDMRHEGLKKLLSQCHHCNWRADKVLSQAGCLWDTTSAGSQWRLLQAIRHPSPSPPLCLHDGDYLSNSWLIQTANNDNNIDRNVLEIILLEITATVMTYDMLMANCLWQLTVLILLNAQIQRHSRAEHIRVFWHVPPTGGSACSKSARTKGSWGLSISVVMWQIKA